MTFQWPHALWLLLALPALIALYVLAQRRRQQYALRYASLSLVREAVGRGPGRRRHVPAILFLAALAVLIVALARPSAPIMLPSDRGTIILAIDVSGSMGAGDLQPTRLEAAKAAAHQFVDRQPPNVAIGVVAFSDNAQLVQAPSTDRAQVGAAIDRLWPERGTAIGRGIIASVLAVYEQYGIAVPPPSGDPFAAPAPAAGGVDPEIAQIPDPPAGGFPSAAIVLLSDGQSNRGPDPLDVVDAIQPSGIRIFTVGVGSPDGVVLTFRGMSIRVQLDEQTLQKIARGTNAQYFRAGNTLELHRIYRQLSTRLVVERRQSELTAYFAGFAALMLLVAGGLSLAWFSRLP
jgi:Ca-activated chloride channel family protein